MDNNRDLVEKFEEIFKQHKSRKPSRLYCNNKSNSPCFQNNINYNAKDVIRNISAQIKAIQTADSVVKSKSVVCNKVLIKNNTSSFLPVNLLQPPEIPPKKSAKFETQFVIDTQLMNVIEDVEAMSSNKGITQEFETSFDDSNIDDVDKLPENGTENKLNNKDGENPENAIYFNDKNSNINDISNGSQSIVRQDKDLKITQEYNLSDNKIHLDDNCTQLLDQCIEVEENIKINNISDEDINPSPIININNGNKSKSTSPLVYNLDSFEKFEKLAVPIIEENNDIDTVKHLINSQIIGKELFLHTDFEAEFKPSAERHSPVLKISKTPKLRAEKQDEAKEYTHNKWDKIFDQINDFSMKDYENASSIETPALDILTKFQKRSTNEQKMNSANLEDEILFSSDEELDTKQTDLNDLPFTCALETSFYEHSDVLDTTMYVGFQTASNKSIQVSAVAFNKAKSILDDDTDCIKPPTLKDLVEKCDVDLKSVASNDSNITRKKTEEIDVSFDITIANDTKFVRFKTANGNPIGILDKNMDKAKSLFYDIDNDSVKDQFKLNVDGFKTASNKNINLSKKALTSCKRVFQDIDLDDNFCDENLLSDIEPCNKKLKHNLENNKFENNAYEKEICGTDFPKIDEDILQEFEGEMSFVDNNVDIKDNNFVGFKTASNKNIKISDSTLLKSKNIFDDIDLHDISVNNDFMNNWNENKFITKQPNVGFKTISNKIITISDEALSKTKDIFQDINTSNIESITDYAEKDKTRNDSMKLIVNRGIGFVGFKTASNKKIRVSEDAIAKTRNLFQDIEKYETHNTSHNKNFENTDMLKKNAVERIDKPSTSKECFVGFKTGNNNKITISDAAIAKTKNIFKDLDDLESERTQNHTTNSIQDKDISNLFNREFDASESNLNLGTKNEENVFKTEGNISANNTFIGFKTASNRAVTISKDALTKSELVFQDIVNNKDIMRSKFEDIHDSNKAIQLNKEASVTGKEILDDLNDVKSQRGFHGFQTASNKEVKISAQALSKSRKIFDDLNILTEADRDKTANTKPVFKGFQTASNEEVKISAEALARSRKLLEDLEPTIEKKSNIKVKENSGVQSNNENSKDLCFVGFQTANNKKVKITAEALEHSKKVFKYLDVVELNDLEIVKNNTNPVFLGFQTASKKEVKVSTEALSKTRKLFEELQKDDDAVLNNNIDNIISTGFLGFQTAENKKVKISTEALAKSRKIFQDLSFKENENDMLENNKQSYAVEGFKTASNKNVLISKQALSKSRQILSDMKTNESRNEKSNPTLSFKTANNNNNIKISEQALLKSRQLLTESSNNESKIPNSDVITKIFADPKVKDTKHDYNFDRLIDTQVIKNFDESLNTEDFRSPENRSKRSGSPILSCPKAKKRKFATPYRKDISQHITESVVKKIEIYDDTYKTNKVYALKDLAKLENSNTDPKITIDLDIDDIKMIFLIDDDNFEFKGARNDLTDTKMSLNILKVHFLNAVNKKLVPDGWFENHIKLIMWKMLSYEIRFPKTMSGICTAKNVLAQVKYRYFKELYNAERPALRKILERDDVASKTMVLCVRDVYNDRDETSGAYQIELLLTDGWYSIRACIDKMLAKYVNNGKIKIGTKIITNGAELMKCEQGVAPWEDTSSVRLKIFGNSTRRARWDARLGYHGNGALLSRLSSVKPEGGKVSKLRVIITRVYPALYVEKFEDGSTVTRSERLEHIHQSKCETDRQALVEKVYEEVEKEMSDEESQDSDEMDIGKHSLDSGSQIARMLKISKEPSQFKANLTDSQRRLLEAHTASKRDKILQKLQDRIQARLSTLSRNVVPLLKVRVADVQGEEIHKALLSIWKPNDALSELITEGASIEILNVVPTAIRYSELQLSAGRQTIFKQASTKTQEKTQPYIKSLSRTCYSIKEIVTHPNMMTDYNEIDTVGLIVQIDPSHKDFKSIYQFQNVYLTDEEKNIICINFWGGIKKFGFENVLDTGQVVACVNLQKRAGNTRKNIPHYRATEFTYFTKTPKNVGARQLIDDLSKNVLKNKGFLDECMAVKNNLLKSHVSNEIISPYRFQNHDLSKNKLYIESPLARVKTDEFNLSGLDFESTFRQTEPQELSPKTFLRKKRINERISKLKMYGEPPPLSPINIINKSKHATKSYKSPLLNQSVASKTPVASMKFLPENRAENDMSCSPVLSVHGTLKRGVNPVKLNFNDVAIDENDGVDHFAEDFDPSPPLSLD